MYNNSHWAMSRSIFFTKCLRAINFSLLAMHSILMFHDLRYSKTWYIAHCVFQTTFICLDDFLYFWVTDLKKISHLKYCSRFYISFYELMLLLLLQSINHYTPVFRLKSVGICFFFNTQCTHNILRDSIGFLPLYYLW